MNAPRIPPFRLMGNRVRVYTDNGWPIYRLFPRLRRTYWDPVWGLWGFNICWLGRQVFFTFGTDRRGFFRKAEAAESEG